MSKKEKKTKSKSETKSKATKKQAIETTALADAPMLETDDSVLAILEDDDDELVPAVTPKKSMRKKESKAAQDEKPRVREAKVEPSAEEAAAVFGIEPDTKPEPLRLPRGAFVGLRKSGGLLFTSSEVVVYPDGRVAFDARGVPQKEYTRLRRVLNDGQTLSLRKLLDQSNFWKAESVGEQNPDGYAYEIAAHLGQRSNEIEVFDGSVPEALQPLVERLSKLLPQE